MDAVHPLIGVAFGISQIVYLATIFTLGVRLGLRARARRELAEGLLAAHFILCAGLGYLLISLGLGASRSPGTLPANATAWLLGSGYFFSNLGVLAAIAFNRLVFRPQAGWAHVAVWLSAAALLVGCVGYGLGGGFSHGRFEGPWFWLFYGTILTGIGWVMVEPLLYYRQMRRRRALGLADPMLVNRFALWSVGSTCRWLMVATGAVTGGVMEGNVSVTFTLTGTALLGLGVAVSYWLTFFPGPAYRRFILRRAEQLRA